MMDYTTSIAALYDGGWRAEDKAEIRSQYGLSIEEAERIAEGLAEIEGENERTGLYKTRYQAKKAAYGHEMVIKVYGGYKIIDCADYRAWRNAR